MRKNNILLSEIMYAYDKNDIHHENSFLSYYYRKFRVLKFSADKNNSYITHYKSLNLRNNPCVIIFTKNDISRKLRRIIKYIANKTNKLIIFQYGFSNLSLKIENHIIYFKTPDLEFNPTLFSDLMDTIINSNPDLKQYCIQ